MKRMNQKSFRCALVFCTVALLANVQVYAQQPGGTPASVVFDSARDGNANNQIYVMDPNGSNQVRITNDVASDVDPDLSPNGQSVVFTSNQPGNNDIFVRDRWGTIRNLTNNPATDEWARWSPNGKRILFASNRTGGVFEIYVMNADGSGTATPLTAPPVLSRYPSWSPDGKQIVFRHGIDIYTMSADGSGTPTQLTSEIAPSFAQMPVFSPDGRYIAFMSFREGYCSVFRMNADGSDQVNLTPRDPNVPAPVWCSRAPAWSADGQEIFFMSSRIGGLNQVFVMNMDGTFVMNMDGTNVLQLTNAGASGSDVSGSPRAR